MRTFKQFQDYIETLATLHKVVAHGPTRKTFFRMDGEEETAAVGGKGSSPSVRIRSFHGQVRRETSIVIAAVITFTSHVPSAKLNLPDAIENAYEQSFNVMWDFWTRIQNEYEEEGACAFTNDLLDPMFVPVGPINQFEYGWEMTIRFGTDSPEYNPNNWTE